MENTDSQNNEPYRLDFASVASSGELSTWVEFRDGISFHVKYISRSELQKLSKKCTTNRFDSKTHQRVTELDQEKFAPQFVKSTVMGWKGLTPNKLATLVRVDMNRVPENKRDTEIAFSFEQMTYLLKNSYDLDAFLNSVVVDLSFFQPEEHEEEVKN